MTFLTIDGNSNLKTPASLQVDLQDLQSSETGRTQNGNMYIDRVVGGAKAKRKVSCTWKGLSQSEISALLQAMSKASFSIKYPDHIQAHLEQQQYMLVTGLLLCSKQEQQTLIKSYGKVCRQVL